MKELMRKNILLYVVLFIVSCSKDKNPDLQDDPLVLTIELPNSIVDYTSMTNWAFHPNKTTILSNYNLDIEIIDENLQVQQTVQIDNNSNINTGIDVFFVHPTVLSQNSIPENIDIENQSSFLINSTIIAQGGLLSKYGRMFAPRYRQSTGVTFKDYVDKELQANIIATSFSDVKAAFLTYLNNYNNGNKIILAGHSQGSYLLSMLLRDLFDHDENLRAQLVTAALGGMGYVYANQGLYQNGWWQNIPLCTTAAQCECINNWTTYDENQSIPEINYGLPEFNPYLINSGLVYRAFNENEDWFVQDFSFYNETTSSLTNYITPNSYNLGTGVNFIAFNGLYNIRHRRENSQKVVLSIEYNPVINDQRPNDLENEQNHPNYPNWGYHIKDYHIYLWALIQQIDEKINNCS
ncbi:DUF3089 domain-containing protein [Kordia zhangzhouensis]|uniref:DUF3089 domain-containing protein n=1 Tax=Kordia zhangzhouensis TaxID=1620405 RepID=UPI000629C669|nr:DUF3089 domain-containing protein [Kordia zhangzhouensis]